MGQQTNVTVVGFCGAVCAIMFWVLGYFAPGFTMSAPPGIEAAVTTVLVGVVCYLLPWGGEPETKTPARPPAPSIHDQST